MRAIWAGHHAPYIQFLPKTNQEEFEWPYGLISASDILVRDIWASKFHRWDFSVQQHSGPRTFRLGNITVPWTFWYRDIRALGHFGTRIFWHMDVLAHINFGTMQSKIHCVAKVYAVLPFYDVKCLSSGGPE